MCGLRSGQVVVFILGDKAIRAVNAIVYDVVFPNNMPLEVSREIAVMVFPFLGSTPPRVGARELLRSLARGSLIIIVIGFILHGRFD